MTTAFFITTALLCAWWYRQSRRQARAIRVNRQNQPGWLD
ncbi:hypothetical protein SAMN05444279_1038 [Ruegeria intermedia]|uniref:Uncharacterized protein n=1 Tax=Ruegeria intermedia TaxID=996115 RepID=A0A1M4TU32_9RHOB|nr:hypothetical protein SAMN05444279_1038 [Ruegeria intermedia]